jgi:hypothetical protein
MYKGYKGGSTTGPGKREYTQRERERDIERERIG